MIVVFCQDTVADQVVDMGSVHNGFVLGTWKGVYIALLRSGIKSSGGDFGSCPCKNQLPFHLACVCFPFRTLNTFDLNPKP